jgi:hypothetical protein
MTMSAFPFAARKQTVASPPKLAMSTYPQHVGFEDVVLTGWMTAMVKVFGCREAYENRPSTNPRAGGDGLWGFRVLPSCGDGSIGTTTRSAETWWVRFFATWALNRELAAAEIQ